MTASTQRFDIYIRIQPYYNGYLKITHTHTRTHARTHARRHAGTHARTHALTHTHTHTHARARAPARVHTLKHTAPVSQSTSAKADLILIPSKPQIIWNNVIFDKLKHKNCQIKSLGAHDPHPPLESYHL